MLPARRVAKESHWKGADVDSKVKETAQAPDTVNEDDGVADVPPAVFFPREDGPAAAWLACARL